MRSQDPRRRLSLVGSRMTLLKEEQKDQHKDDDKLQSNQFNLLTVCVSFVAVPGEG
jgi:hypothetical protein